MNAMYNIKLISAVSWTAVLTVACLSGCKRLESSPPPPNPSALYEAGKMERLKPVFTTGEFTYQAYQQPPQV